MTKLKDLVEKYGNREIDEVELEKLLKPEPSRIYALGQWDKYWFINPSGQAIPDEWINHRIDKAKLAIGNVFLTEEDAEFEIEKRKVEAELKRYASMCETEVDWNNGNQTKYSLGYDHICKSIEIHLHHHYNHAGIVFTNNNVLKESIKEIGEERIKKYYFGIKGDNK